MTFQRLALTVAVLIATSLPRADGSSATDGILEAVIMLLVARSEADYTV